MKQLLITSLIILILCLVCGCSSVEKQPPSTQTNSPLKTNDDKLESYAIQIGNLTQRLAQIEYDFNQYKTNYNGNIATKDDVIMLIENDKSLNYKFDNLSQRTFNIETTNANMTEQSITTLPYATRHEYPTSIGNTSLVRNLATELNGLILRTNQLKFTENNVVKLTLTNKNKIDINNFGVYVYLCPEYILPEQTINLSSTFIYSEDAQCKFLGIENGNLCFVVTGLSIPSSQTKSYPLKIETILNTTYPYDISFIPAITTFQ